MGMKRKNKVALGDRFGRGVVFSEFKRNSHYYARLSCDCGTEYESPLVHLFSGRRKSCGCLRKEELRKRMSEKTTHGLASNPLYRQYAYLQTLPMSKVYGSWRESPEAFIRWVEKNLGKAPEGARLVRIDRSRPYEPGNLAWLCKTCKFKVPPKNYKRKVVKK